MTCSRFVRFALAAPTAAVLLALFSAAPAAAQPYGAWLNFDGHPTHGYVRIPTHPDLDPADEITFEAWVSVGPGSGCRSIAGKGYESAWWVGVCLVGGQPQLRSYLRGSGSARTGGILLGGWNHVAVTFDGSARRHYINGELAASWAESGALTSNLAEVRIGSDVDFPYTPAGSIDEVRLWRVARSQAQIRQAINVPLSAAQPGLVAVWHLGDGSPIPDPAGGHHGTILGSGVTPWTFPVILDCGSGTSAWPCLNERFSVSVRWRTSPEPGTTDGGGTVAVHSADSAVFWFFSSANWELMVKVLNGCGLNNRYWVFSAATTNVFYRMDVMDVRSGVNKVYFNYPGPPAPAVTDVNAFASCP